eukprot:1573438-Pleurochrysis_carterae.AAC.3
MRRRGLCEDAHMGMRAKLRRARNASIRTMGRHAHRKRAVNWEHTHSASTHTTGREEPKSDASRCSWEDSFKRSRQTRRNCALDETMSCRQKCL